jgi:hypothetical protein
MNRADLRGLPLYLNDDGTPVSSPEAVGAYIGELLLHGGATWVDIPAMVAATTSVLAQRLSEVRYQRAIDAVAQVIRAERLCSVHGEDIVGVLLYTGAHQVFPRPPGASPNVVTPGDNVGFREFADAVEKAYAAQEKKP